MEVLLSPIAHIHGSCKFVIDSVLLFLRRRLLEKKKKLNVGDLCYQHIIPLNWIQARGSRLRVVSVFSTEWQITWMASEMRLHFAALHDQDWSGQEHTCTPLLSLGWLGSSPPTSWAVQCGSVAVMLFLCPRVHLGESNLIAGAAKQWMSSDSLWILLAEVVLVHGCGGRFSCRLSHSRVCSLPFGPWAVLSHGRKVLALMLLLCPPQETIASPRLVWLGNKSPPLLLLIPDHALLYHPADQVWSGALLSN